MSTVGSSDPSLDPWRRYGLRKKAGYCVLGARHGLWEVPRVGLVLPGRWADGWGLMSYPGPGPFAVQGPLASHWPGPPALSSVSARLLRAFSSPAEKKIAALLRPVWERCFSQNSRATVLYYTQSRWALAQGPTFVLYFPSCVASLCVSGIHPCACAPSPPPASPLT